jgi:short-subunit dehydrogenase
MESLSQASNKLAVVTGGSRGIGASIIRKLASQGFDIITYARNEADLLKLNNEITNKYKCKLSYQLIDAADSQQIEKFGAFVSGFNRRIDVLINNAGLFKPGPMADETIEEFRHLMAVNFDSACTLTRNLLPRMKAAGTGHIINICSIASITAYPAGGSYATAKSALLGYTRNLRAELRNQGIRVTAVLPGATLTDSWSGAGLPETRFIPPEDVANAVWMCIELSDRTVVEEILLRPQLGDI